MTAPTGWLPWADWLAEQRRRLGTVGWRMPTLLGTAALVVGWAYWPTLQTIAQRWSNDPQYSHGFLVPFFAAVVLWVRKPDHPEVRWETDPWGLVWLGLAGLCRLAAATFYFDWLDALSLLPTLTGICYLLIGQRGLRWAWPVIGFLVFMLPAPFQFEVALAHPLQRLATNASTYVLQTLGLPAVAEGNVIHIDSVQLGVGEACSGLGMLITFFALSTAFALILNRRWPERLVIFFSAAPIAVVVNIARICLTAVLFTLGGERLARLIYHDMAGWLMMPLALALMGLELRFMDRMWLPAEPDRPLALGLNQPAELPGKRLDAAAPVAPLHAHPTPRAGRAWL